ncbi:hypothetical protein [Homoserinimonas sp. OAct 916]|uniref:hypothetical protein n=1 Tax=Homoserinimonas sp. OAct 916 TaxID=2211450 RepID=UPI00130074AD|nr:hypothetical protein [Homoserinimonas sp. OAct 916]
MWIDLEPSAADGDLSYHYRWTTNAVEYLEYVQARVQLWHQSFDQRKAQEIHLVSYNNWLIQTGRWSPNN